MAISNVNILPEIELYNGAIGTVVEIVYNNRPVGPNDKEHCHLPDYVIVNFLKPEITGLHATMGPVSQNGELETLIVTCLTPH